MLRPWNIKTADTRVEDDSGDSTEKRGPGELGMGRVLRKQQRTATRQPESRIAFNPRCGFYFIRLPDGAGFGTVCMRSLVIYTVRKPGNHYPPPAVSFLPELLLSSFLLPKTQNLLRPLVLSSFSIDSLSSLSLKRPFSSSHSFSLSILLNLHPHRYASCLLSP